MSKPARPNVLLLVSEDHGHDLGCYGDSIARTPRLDQLAQQGARFVNAYVTQAGCSPSRASLLTGIYPHQCGQIGLATHLYRMYSASITNLPALLKDSGYRTGLIGKLHVLPEESFPYHFRSIVESLNHRDVLAIAKRASNFFAADDKPFFLQISYVDAHAPYDPELDGQFPRQRTVAEDVRTLPLLGYTTPAIQQTLASYYNCLSRLDTGIGMVLDALEVAGKADDTLVIYLSDHGPQMPRGKRTCYEGGVRVPFIVRFPGRIKPGIKLPLLVSTIDVMPTVLEAAGLPIPTHAPGRSLLAMMAGDAVPWREFLFCEYTVHWPATYFPQRSVRDDRFKLVHNLLPDRDNPNGELYLNDQRVKTLRAEDLAHVPQHVHDTIQRFLKPPEFELFDLEADPWEFHNLAEDPVFFAVLDKFKKVLANWQQRTDDPLRHPTVSNVFRTKRMQ